ncbi:DNA-binding transcriptional LysR family regulator [Bradyrhizobium sp. LM3.2]
MIGCVAADMGVTLLPRAVVERSAINGSVTIHALGASHARVETLFIQRRAGHQTSALSGFSAACLKKNDDVIAA